MSVHIFWFRRDLRLHDHRGLHTALTSGKPVLPIFIFDPDILDELERDDARVSFIHDSLMVMHRQLVQWGSGLRIFHGNPQEVFSQLLQNHQVDTVFAVRDYEPYATQRDRQVGEWLQSQGSMLELVKDQVIFEQSEVVKDDGKPYTVYTPYSRKWFANFDPSMIEEEVVAEYADRFLQGEVPAPMTLEAIGFRRSQIQVAPFDVSEDLVAHYEERRNFPAIQGCSQLGPHLRFGTVSIREVVRIARQHSETFWKELIWREFFMQILHHFPKVVDTCFKEKYERVPWKMNEAWFEAWCEGRTGYPMVDAGMRELNQTGYMHNRVRMVVASFLTKHLMIDWRKGEAYFAKKLLDYELSSNNGNWQWAAGCGCDASPYFRVFNPESQLKKFDGKGQYIRKWLPEFGTPAYPKPIVDHKEARQRAIDTYKQALG
ncbi:deoxyribodipyrimidine photo-lyase [Pontibacter sp. G13]|uniref:cryptochrome/photolyase family protein n=1 Tax=Pontibacter sp. G13 TaxID=3074898 RepID=UPI002889DEAB|nr:deoxyribodipyrimidine photo-lyase [Pontibacter sp. G13]WNJ19153.1 deoxyribodipyrimidine photo-lyase [Pontibacter sp. G13]